MEVFLAALLQCGVICIIMQFVQCLARSMQAYQYIMLPAEHEPMALHTTQGVSLFYAASMFSTEVGVLFLLQQSCRLAPEFQNMAEVQDKKLTDV